MSTQVDQSLQDAITEFKSILTDDQKKDLEKITTVEKAEAVIRFTAELDRRDLERKGSSIASRLYSTLQSVQQFSSVVDTFVSARPDIAALVWGSVKLTMLVVVNFTSYFKQLSELFMGFHKFFPQFDEYRKLYPHSSRLQRALCDFHASIIRCCKKAVEVIQRPWPDQVYNALWQSSDKEFDSFKVWMKTASKEVNAAIAFAKAEVDHQEQQLQSKERKAASSHRHELRTLLSKAGRKIEDSREWQIQSNERRARERKIQLLDSLSSYDYQRAFRQARKKRHNNTALWLTHTPEFAEWIDSTEHPVFWTSGKLGSGKTILTTGVIDHLFLTRETSTTKPSIAFFFSRFDESTSLKAETILRSIIRQFLDPARLTRDIESDLEKIQKDPISDLEDLERLLQKQISKIGPVYIVIDALDECEKCERDAIFRTLSSAITAGVKIKLFLSSRESISQEITKRFRSLQHVSMNSPRAEPDIARYVADVINEKLNDEELLVGNKSLVQEIQDVLIQGSQGMFLWVSFQIHEICSQKCDEDIRKVLADLPKDLTETFERALGRIISHRNERIAQQVFRWVAAVKRPLSLEELREAISVEPCQEFFKPDKLVNGINRIAAWCENLVELDEELDTVQFPHHTVQKFFLSDVSNPRYSQFQVNLEDVDHYVGEVCVTFLNLNDFKTTLIRRPRLPPTTITPGAIWTEVSEHQQKTSITMSLLHRFSKFSLDNKTSSIDITKELASYSTERSMEDIYRGHPFLKYASDNWLFHTKAFKENSKTWNLWIHMIRNGHDLSPTPWTNTQFMQSNQLILEWCVVKRHWALLRIVLDKAPQTHLDDLMRRSAQEGDIELLNILLGVGVSPSSIGVLQVAAEEGHLEVVERLLAADADVNAPAAGSGGRTALQAAAQGGHLEIVKRLLAANADVNAPAAKFNGWTALQAAAQGGHLEVVERLLAANADVNAPATGYSGQTALQAAAQGGHLEVVERLLAANADVNALATASGGRTALQAAAQGGSLEVVERLLAAHADVNAPATGYSGRTALQAAAQRGYLEVVERLLAANADVNAPATGSGGRTALQAAAQGGHLEVVERLLAADADVNALATVSGGRTALQAAAQGGSLEVVERLLAAHANVNAPATGYGGRTALQAAAQGGHLEVVERLLAANADVNAPVIESGGWTALQAAAQGGHLEVVERLLAANADVNALATKYGGRTALQAAAQGGHLEVVERLLAANADVNAAPAVGSGGRTALQAAAQRGYLEVVERLLAANADVNAPATGFDGRTALQVAAEEGHLEVVSRLELAGAR